MTIQYRGANLAGGDVAFTKWQGRELQKDSDYLFVKTADVDYLLAKGVNFFRLLFSWEALQPTPNAAIPGGTGFGVYFQQIKALVDDATSKGATVCIDIHGGIDTDFAAYYNAKIGTTYQGFSVEALFIDLWTKLANIFKSNPRVWFGLVNEPSNMPTMTWWAAAQKVTTAIRGTGATNKILVPGAGFTAASTWTGALWTDTGATPRSNAYGWANAGGVGVPFKDPIGNTAVQVHLYADANAGGYGTDVVSGTILSERLKITVDWARTNKVQVFVAEVGLVATATSAKPAWSNFVAYLEANADIVLGFSWWAYGPPVWWGGYPFALCPKTAGGADSPQMDMIEGTLAAPVVVDPTAALKVQIVDLQIQLAASKADTATATAQLNVIANQYNKLDADYVSVVSQLSATKMSLDTANGQLDAIRAVLA